MKTFTQLNESCVTADVNQGNAYSVTGVTNHLTPINNIVTNIRNLFATHLGIVASVAEDGVSVKLNSSKFVNPREIQKILYNYEIMRGTNLANYIMQQGLDFIKTVNLGQYYVVYFSPSDIKIAMPGLEPKACDCPCKEMVEYNLDEAEMIMLTESDDDEEMEDVTKKKLQEIIVAKDKVKAAKQLELLVAQEMELPREYYFAGVKDKAGNESIALRWKRQKRTGKGKSTEVTMSLLNIYDDSKDGVFVSEFDKDSIIELPEEVKKLIENVLEFIGAEKTNDDAVYSLAESDKKDKDDKDKKDDKNDKDDKDKKDDEEDTEDDDSRGDKSDDLLS